MASQHLKSKCQAILQRHKHQGRSTLTATEFETVYKALQNHSKAKAKIGCGVKSIFVQEDPYGSFCFHVERVDGSEEDFSYKKCFNMPPSEQSRRKGYTYKR